MVMVGVEVVNSSTPFQCYCGGSAYGNWETEKVQNVITCRDMMSSVGMVCSSRTSRVVTPSSTFPEPFLSLLYAMQI